MRTGRAMLAICLLSLPLLFLPACGGGLKRTAVATTPAAPVAVPAPGGAGGADEATAAPTFRKVTPEENTALVPPTLPAQPGQAGAAGGVAYLIEVEDHLDISVYGEADLQHVEVPVRPDGMISFAFVGDIAAAGRTVEDLRQEMTQKLGQYLRNAQVTVIAKQFAQKKVFVGGEVKTPGILYLTGKEGTLLDALYKAGLTTEKADLEGAFLVRGNKVVDANFKQLVRGDLAGNVRLMNQDIIFVPENTRRYVYVLGEVQNSTAVETLEPVPIIRVLSQAGWFRLGANRKEIAVVRGGLKTPEIATVNARALVKGDLSQNIMVFPGDIVYVAPGLLGKFNYVIDEILRLISPVVQGVIVSNTVNPPTRTVK